MDVGREIDVLVKQLWFRSHSETLPRGMRHLLNLDLHELYEWCVRHPESVTEGPVPDGGGWQ